MRTLGKGHCERLLHFVKIIHETEMCVVSPFYDECVVRILGHKSSKIDSPNRFNYLTTYLEINFVFINNIILG